MPWRIVRGGLWVGLLGLTTPVAQGAPLPPRPRWECREGTLLDEQIARAFLARGRQTLARWQELATPEALAADLVEAANTALGQAGVPRVRRPAVEPLTKPRWIEFRSGRWHHGFDPEPLRRRSLTDAQGLALPALVYHEVRHVEQFWLMARWRVRLGSRSEARLGEEAGAPRPIARKARACPFPKGSSLEPQIRRWFEDDQRSKKAPEDLLAQAWKRPDGGVGKAGDPWDEAERRTPEQREALERYEQGPRHADTKQAEDLIWRLGKESFP